MALTSVSVDLLGNVVAQVPGAKRQLAMTLTGDASYPTGGYPVTFATFGMNEAIEQVMLNPSSGAHLVVWDSVNSKIKFFTAVATEVANAVNLSAVTVKALIIGL